MTVPNLAAPPRMKLPVIETTAAAYDALWRYRDDLLRVAAVPAAITFGIYLAMAWQLDVELVGDPLNPPAMSPGALALILALWLPFILFSVNWTRVLLLGGASVRGLGLHWGLRETKYLLRMLAMMLAAMLAALVASLPFILAFVVVGFAAGDVGTMAGPGLGVESKTEALLIALVAVPVIVVEFYVMFRLMLALPATALDRPGALGLAWNVAKGTVGRLVLVYLLVVVPPYLIIFALQFLLGMAGLFEAAPFSAQLISTILGFVLTAAGSGAIALSYRRLVGVAPA